VGYWLWGALLSAGTCGLLSLFWGHAFLLAGTALAVYNGAGALLTYRRRVRKFQQLQAQRRAEARD